MSRHHRKLENMYRNAPCNAMYEPHIRVEDGKATVEIDVRPDLFHAAGAVHGSVYFKLLDDGAYFAANSRVEDLFLLTLDFNVQFIRPVSRGVMRAEGRVVEMTRTMIFADSSLTDGDDSLLATGRGIFTRSRIALTSEVGYGD